MASVDAVLAQGPPVHSLAAGLSALRSSVLHSGVPSTSDGTSDSRIYIWLTLLNATPLRTDAYLDLVRQGASPAYAKIRNDTFRTLTTDPLYRRKVTENSLTRVLNAVAWKLHDANEARVNGWMSPPTLGVPRSLADAGEWHSPASGGTSRHTRGSVTGTEGSEAGDAGAGGGVGYVQGMNVMAAPFMYVAKSEAEAFAGFEKFITFECPAYVRGSMEGVHKGLALVDRLLELLDPQLSAHLLSKGMKAEIYGFASVLTMCACTPPLPEVLLLWDFLFAYGSHLNLLCIVAQLVMVRDQLLSSASPKPNFTPLRAKKVIEYTVDFARRVPDDLYREMLAHAK
nr:hypothetical protein B0A51_07998 [Rachicladosporium sp. CCFEE 5018]